MCCCEGEEIILLCPLKVIYTWFVCSLSINIVMKERPADTEDSTHNTGHSTTTINNPLTRLQLVPDVPIPDVEAEYDGHAEPHHLPGSLLEAAGRGVSGSGHFLLGFIVSGHQDLDLSQLLVFTKTK